MATIEQRGPNTWRVGIRLATEEGRKWIRQTLTFPASMPLADQRARAELAAAKLTVDAAEGRAVPSHQLTVREFAAIWLEEHVKPTCTENTYRNYKFLLESRILPELGGCKLQKLSPMILVRFINAVKEDQAHSSALPPEKRVRASDRTRPAPQPRQLSDRTVRHYYDTLNYMLNKAVQWQYLNLNPMERVDRPKIRRQPVHFLDDRQAVQLLRCLANEESLPFRCAVLLALLCGLRLGEVGGLNLSDVDWDNCSIDIQRALKYTPEEGSFLGDPKSEAGRRTIDLPAGMMALLEETRKYHEDAAAALGDRWRGTGRIVSAWDGTPVHHDTPSKWFRKFADANGFQGVRFHDLRHTHATLLFANNIDAVAVASRLGHEDASTTMRIYAHAIRRRDKESAAAMQALIDRAFSLDDPDPGSDTGK